MNRTSRGYNTYGPITASNPADIALGQKLKVLRSPLDYSTPDEGMSRWGWVNGNAPVKVALTSYAPNYRVYASLPEEAMWDMWKNRGAGRATMGTFADGTSNTMVVAEKLAIVGNGVQSGPPNEVGNNNWGDSWAWGWGIINSTTGTPYFAGVCTANGDDWGDNRGLWETPQARPNVKDAVYWRTQALSAGGSLVALADGSVRAVGNGVSVQTWSAAITPNGGETLGSDW